jgi:hypothetical protein
VTVWPVSGLDHSPRNGLLGADAAVEDDAVDDVDADVDMLVDALVLFVVVVVVVVVVAGVVAVVVVVVVAAVVVVVVVVVVVAIVVVVVVVVVVVLQSRLSPAPILMNTFNPPKVSKLVWATALFPMYKAAWCGLVSS